jgi:hypothetical protein
MTYFDTTFGGNAISLDEPLESQPEERALVMLVLDDDGILYEALCGLCGFFDVRVERIDSNEPLLPFLKRCRPMAVVAPLDSEGQDGAHVLMTVARYDRSLPVLLLGDGDAALAGATDAVAEVWGLSSVTQSAGLPSPGALADFVCRAGVQGHCLGMLPT